MSTHVIAVSSKISDIVQISNTGLQNVCYFWAPYSSISYFDARLSYHTALLFLKFGVFPPCFYKIPWAIAVDISFPGPLDKLRNANKTFRQLCSQSCLYRFLKNERPGLNLLKDKKVLAFISFFSIYADINLQSCIQT